MLQLAWMCGAHHLPDSGGVMDQDYSTMRQMRILNNVHNAVRDVRSAVGPDIHSLPADTLRVIGWLREQGLY